MATVFFDELSELDPKILREIQFTSAIRRGAVGPGAKRVQEWLSLHDHRVAIDGQFGPATQRAVSSFQWSNGLTADGTVDETTWNALVQPMVNVLGQRLDQSMALGEATLAYAKAHLAEHPLEVGGANRGPWVRLYMNGFDGDSALWCAGFAVFAMKQAADSMGAELPIAGSFSCDVLAQQGKDAGLFLHESEATPDQLTPGSFFLVRKTSTDWTHTGLVEEVFEDSFTTIEGNTNDSGDREGYEVCHRTRDYSTKDFVVL
jgi:hypothetical protein